MKARFRDDDVAACGATVWSSALRDAQSPSVHGSTSAAQIGICGSRRPWAVRFGFLSTYPPTQCGIATFTESLVRHLHRSGAHVGVVRLVDEPAGAGAPRRAPVGDAVDAVPRSTPRSCSTTSTSPSCSTSTASSADRTARTCSTSSAPARPGHHRAAHRAHRTRPRTSTGSSPASSTASAALVTMTETARDRLVAGWGVDPAQVTVIPHGAEDNRTDHPSPLAAVPLRPTVLTWGLLSRGQGHRVGAARARRAPRDDRRSRATASSGRPTRECSSATARPTARACSSMTHHLGLDDAVRLRRPLPLRAGPAPIVSEADVVLLPYDSAEQVTSGVLTEAVAAGKPVVSTSFPHAVELLSSGAGLLVPQRRPGRDRRRAAPACSRSPGCATTWPRGRAGSPPRCCGRPSPSGTSSSAAPCAGTAASAVRPRPRQPLRSPSAPTEVGRLMPASCSSTTSPT